jgi:hypothetical protein
MMFRSWLCLCGLSLMLVACPWPPVKPNADVADFDGHTVASFDDEAAFLAYGDSEKTPVQVKYVMAAFDQEAGVMFYLDPSFYTLHDEWFWFILLNGVSVPGVDVMPAQGLSFTGIEDVYDAFKGVAPLPLDLTWTKDGRLYSPMFYAAALAYGQWSGTSRALGIGSLLYYPPNPKRVIPQEIWCFELEYIDKPDEAVLKQFFSRLETSLPTSVGKALVWLSRGSPEQDALAAELKAGDGPYADRIISYDDLVVIGEEVAYNEGITAGRIKRVPQGAVGAASVGPHDIVVLGKVPDDLPPVAGIVTAVPQTPLAHLNLLAKARGTPNVYIGGVMDDEQLVDWESWNTPVILKVGEGGVTWHAMSKNEYARYKQKLGKPDMTLPKVDIETLPYTADLTDGGMAEIAGLIPSCGGKSSGMMGFQDFPELEVPYRPLGLTIRSYHEHVSNYVPMLETVLSDPDFLDDGRIRYVFFEGEDDFKEEHADDPEALAWLDVWLASHGPASLLGGPVAVGGFKRMLRDKPVWTPTMETLSQLIAERYDALATTQGLRFRSSSTAEDIKGFNGAGLYDSNTGYIDPTGLSDAKLQKRTLEWALKKTWASYWSFEAFEERQAAGIDHLAGNMGALVHPRFDDALELANGVITFTLRGSGDATELEMVLNTQKGAISVTNPDPANPTTPEIDRVLQKGGGASTVTRIQASSEMAMGAWVLTEEELLWLHAQLGLLAQAWLEQANTAWPAPQKSLSLVLDLEFKKMSKAWPARDSGELAPMDRLVMKQVRTLDSAITVGELLEAEPVPRDILSMTSKVWERRCENDAFSVTVLEFYTGPSFGDVVDFSETPFVARVALDFKKSLTSPAIPEGQVVLNHTQWQSLSYPDTAGEGWEMLLILSSEQAEVSGFKQVRILSDGSWSVSDGASEHTGTVLTCDVIPRLVGASEYLESLLPVR